MVAVLAPDGAGLLRSSHEGGPREDGGLFGETGFCLYSIVFRFLYFRRSTSLSSSIDLPFRFRRGGGVFREPRANSAGGVVVAN